MGDNVTSAVLIAGPVLSVWLPGRLALRRGRSFRTWASIGAIIGPLALPLLYLFPKRKNGHVA